MNLVVPVVKRINFLLLLLFLALLQSTYAQEAEPATNVSAETAPATAEPATEDEKFKRKNTYLDIFHAKTSASNLKAKLLVDIHRLRVMVYNYGDSDEKASYDKIKDNYKESVKLMYLAKFVKADDSFKSTRNNVQELYGKMAQKYRSKTAQMLNQCADQLVDMELTIDVDDEELEAFRKRKLAAKTRIRLMVAYSQLSMGEAYERDEEPGKSITHYRVARLHAVEMLVDLAKTSRERNELMKQYQPDLLDIDSIVFNEAPTE